MIKRSTKVNYDINAFYNLTYLFLDSEVSYQILKCSYKGHPGDNT